MDIVERLLHSEEPSVRYLARVGVVGEDPGSPELGALRAEIAKSPRVAALLSERDENGRIPGSVYSKWRGAHWVISALADIGYPAGDDKLRPLIDQTLEAWLGERHLDAVQTLEGRTRRCTSGRS